MKFTNVSLKFLSCWIINLIPTLAFQVGIAKVLVGFTDKYKWSAVASDLTDKHNTFANDNKIWVSSPFLISSAAASNRKVYLIMPRPKPIHQNLFRCKSFDQLIWSSLINDQVWSMIKSDQWSSLINGQVWSTIKSDQVWCQNKLLIIQSCPPCNLLPPTKRAISARMSYKIRQNPHRPMRCKKILQFSDTFLYWYFVLCALLIKLANLTFTVPSHRIIFPTTAKHIANDCLQTESIKDIKHI